MVAESRDLLLRSFILVSLLFILGELYLYIRYIFIISTHPPFLQFLQDPSSRHAPISTVCCLIKVFSVWPVQNVLPLRAMCRGGGILSLPFWFSLGFNDLGHRRPLEASSVWVLF